MVIGAAPQHIFLIDGDLFILVSSCFDIHVRQVRSQRRRAHVTLALPFLYPSSPFASFLFALAARVVVAAKTRSAFVRVRAPELATKDTEDAEEQWWSA